VRIILIHVPETGNIWVTTIVKDPEQCIRFCFEIRRARVSFGNLLECHLSQMQGFEKQIQSVVVRLDVEKVRCCRHWCHVIHRGNNNGVTALVTDPSRRYIDAFVFTKD
jgi:hypothetical protein